MTTVHDERPCDAVVSSDVLMLVWMIAGLSVYLGANPTSHLRLSITADSVSCAVRNTPKLIQ